MATTYQKMLIAEAAHLLHPDHKPREVFVVVVDEGEVPEPPKPTVVDEKETELAELKARIAALESGK